MPEPAWTTADELVAQVRRLWDRGVLLRDSEVFPKQLRLRRPTTSEIGARFEEVRRWIRQLEEDCGERGLRLEFEEVIHRQLGRNRVPARVLVASRAEALRLLGKEHDARRFDALFDRITAAFPLLREWSLEHPLRVLDLDGEWDRVLSVLAWFWANPRSGIFRRQIELSGIDTKFIEAHRALLTELLELVCEGAFDVRPRAATFDRMFGLREKPTLLRMRLLDDTQLLHGLSDVTAPVAELSRLRLPAEDVIVTENEVNGLSLPGRRSTLVLFGQGYALERLKELSWLEHKRVFYWGDIDTHGFAMLDRFRAHLPAARALMMDRRTLLAHRKMWVVEAVQCMEQLSRLTPEEQELYAELTRGTLEDRVRLEQERIGFTWVREALDSIR